MHSLAQLPPYLTQQMSAPPGRTHRYLSTAPLFPFGFGLTSHAAAHYARLRVTPASVPANAPAGLNITVEVELSRPVEHYYDLGLIYKLLPRVE